MKIKLVSTFDADYPNDWASEEWKLTRLLKDDISDIFKTLDKVVTEYKQIHSQVETRFDLEITYNGTFFLSCMRKLTDDEKNSLKKTLKERKESQLKLHKREVKAEAKRLGLL
jgi:hypothetical protein